MPAQARERLRRRWDSGGIPRRYALGEPWQPVDIPLRGPRASDLSTDFEAARAWVRQWQGRPATGFRVEYREVGGRTIGANLVPDRAWVDSYADAFVLLGVTREVAMLDDVLAATGTLAPRLTGWVREHPLRALDASPRWHRLLQTATWIEQHARRPVYVREVDVPGVDTKFIEGNRALLAELLDVLLDDDRVDRTLPRSDFVGRYRFRRKPQLVRVRSLGGAAGSETMLPGGFTELAVRVDELAAVPLPVSTVYVVENETTYLAFPPARDAVVVLGGGYALSRLQPLEWLRERDLRYWGDIDTHGLAILDQLRQAFPHVRSILMDRATLLAHESQWVQEPSQSTVHLAHLTPTEADLYRDLVEDNLGPSVRLEQERVRFSLVEAATAHPLRRGADAAPAMIHVPDDDM